MVQRVDEDRMFMDFAIRASERSHGVRLKVGCVIVKDESVISLGWNGMPAGMDNTCEHTRLVNTPDGLNLRLKTNDEVLHAEMNAIAKLAASHMSASGATLYITHSPCIGCSVVIHRAKIAEVIYQEPFRLDSGLEFLRSQGVVVRQLR